MTIQRRRLIQASIAAGTGIAFPSIVFGEAQFRLKVANIMPADHPLNLRLEEANAQIKQLTNGQVDIQVFPGSQLGTDADMLAQVRSGRSTSSCRPASSSPRSCRSPRSTASALPFRLRERLACHGRGSRQARRQGIFDKANLIAFDKMWDNGFRQTLSVSKPSARPTI